MAVPALVGCSVVEPEVCAQVNKRDAAVEDCRGDALTVPMWERCEDEVDPIESAVEFLDNSLRTSSREVRMHCAEQLPCLALAEQLRGRELGMRGDQPQQLAADKARGSKDRRPNHGGAPIHVIAYLCK